MPSIDSMRLLRTKHPNLVAEWHPDKNVSLSLDTVYAGSAKKAWWKCKQCNHEWEYSIIHRAKGDGKCPLCSKTVLLTSNPELAKEWGSKNTTSPIDHKPGSRTRVWWSCPAGHEEYMVAIANRRLLGSKCPKCRDAVPGKSLSDVAPHLISEWSDKNQKSPSSTFARSAEQVCWICSKCSHEWVTRVSYRVAKDRGCPKCNDRLISDTNLALLFPLIASEYSEKNELKSDEIAAGSRKLCLWQCERGHEYEMRPFERTKDMSNCPQCRLETKSLAAKFPEIAKEFDVSRNGGKTANDYMAGSPQRVFWKCLEVGHVWEVAINSRTKKNRTGCPECIRSGTSDIEDIIRESIKQDDIIIVEKDKQATISLKWRRNSNLRVDIAGYYNGHPIVIEYDGWYWHTGQKKKDSITPLKRDLAKTQALLNAEYLVIRIREERSQTVKLDLLDIEHPNLLQFHWNHLTNQNDTSLIQTQIYDWLHSKFENF